MLSLALFISRRHLHKISSQYGMIFTYLVKYICGLKFQIIGSENIIYNQPIIIASNHQSTWETHAFVLFFPQHVWVLKKELLKLPVFGWGLRLASPIAIDRKDKINNWRFVLNQAKLRIKDGFSILIFPEGTRVKPGMQAKEYKAGAARLALELNLPIVPVNHNAGLFMPKNSMVIYPGNITVDVSKPIYPNKNYTVEELHQEIIKYIIKR